MCINCFRESNARSPLGNSNPERGGLPMYPGSARESLCACRIYRRIVPSSAIKKRAPTTPRANGRPYLSCALQRPHSNLRRTSWTFCLTNSYPRRRGWSTCNQRFADCGYRSASRFTNSFHERFGLPPSEFCSSMSDNEPDLGVGGHRLPRPCTVVRTTLFHSGGNYV